MAICPNDIGAVGDGGTEDGPALLAAFATGQDVFLKDRCTYLVNTVTLQPTAGQRVYGGGKLKKTVRSWALPSEGPQDAPKFFRIYGVNNVLLDGIAMEWTGANDGPRVYGATIESATDCEIRNCSFPGQTTAAFIWKYSKRTVFHNNRTYGGLFGLALGGDGAGNTDGAVENTIVAGNIIRGAYSEGIDVNWDVVYATIAGNQLRGNNVGAGEEEIDIGGGQCRDIIVSDNIVDGAGLSGTGINVKMGSKNVKVADNVLRNFRADSGAAVSVMYGASETDILGNTIYGCNKGVWVRSAQGAPTGINIANNRIAYYTTFGVHLDGVSGASLGDIQVSNNKLDGCDVGLDGLLAEYVNDLIAEGNRARQNQRGMRFGAGMSGIVSGNNLKGNSVAAITGQSNFAAGSIVADNVS